jgi:hypothetical protein
MKNTSTSVSVTTFTDAVESEIGVIQDLKCNILRETGGTRSSLSKCVAWEWIKPIKFRSVFPLSKFWLKLS